MKINNIEQIKEYNIICTNAKETKECFGILERLGLPINSFCNNDLNIVVCYHNDMFGCYGCIAHQNYKNISFYNFKQETKKFLPVVRENRTSEPTCKKNLQVDEKAMIEYIINNYITISYFDRNNFNKFINILNKYNCKLRFSKEKLNEEDYESNICLSLYDNRDVVINSKETIDKYLIKNLSIQKLFDKFKIEKKEDKPLEDIEYDSKTGRVIKINNINSSLCVYHTILGPLKISDYHDDFGYSLKTGKLFISQETREKAEERLKVKTQLENIALRLNNGKEIDWNDYQQQKYSFFYCYKDKTFVYEASIYRQQGTIYCLSKNFLKTSLTEIGKDNLKLLFE